MIQTDFQRTDGLEQTFFHRPADTHRLSRRLHLRAEGIIRIGKLIKRKTGHFRHHIIQSRFKSCRGIRDLYFIQRHTDTDLCRYPGNRISAGLRCQRRGPGNSRIDLNQIILKGIRVQGKLYITAAFDFEGADNFQRAVPEHMILLIGQGLGRAHNDRISGMNTYRIQIFHITDRDRGIVAVPHHFIFNFFITFNTFFNQHLLYRRKGQRLFHQR